MSFSPRSASLIALAALVVGWFDSSAVNNGSMQPSSVPGSSRPARSPAPVPRAERLRERIVAPPTPGRGRNPFVYGSRVSPRPDYRDRSPEPEMPPAEPVAPPPPMFRLSGIASDMKDGATVLTAIIIDNGAMVFAKTGDKLSNGVSVVRVDEMSVTLIDATGITQTIRLP